MATVQFDDACPVCSGTVVQEDDERGTYCQECFAPLKETDDGFVIARAPKGV
jgi:reverse gyrase